MKSEGGGRAFEFRGPPQREYNHRYRVGQIEQRGRKEAEKAECAPRRNFVNELGAQVLIDVVNAHSFCFVRAKEDRPSLRALRPSNRCPEKEQIHRLRRL